MNRYQVYKETGFEWLGKIPSDWKLHRAGKFFNERSEKVDDVNYPPLSVTMLGIVDQLSNVVKTDDGKNRKLVKKNDFVINSRSDRKGSSGIALRDGSVSLINIVLEPNGLNPNFSEYLFKSYYFKEEYFRNGRGIHWDLWTTRWDQLKNINIPIPPSEEQKLISRYLDKKTEQIDRLVEKIQKKIELIKEQRTSLINHYVTKGLDPNVEMKYSGIEWIGEIPKHWNVSKIKYVSRVENGSTPKSDNSDFWEGEVRWFTPTDFKTKDHFGNLIEPSRYISQEGLEGSGCSLINEKSILMTTRAPVGNLSKIDGPFTFNQGCKSITTLNANMDYLYFYLLSRGEVLNVLSNGTTFKELSTDDLLNFLIPLPSQNEQIKISERLIQISSHFHNLVSSFEEKLSLLEEYRKSLISSVVTGKVLITEDMI